MPRLRDLGPLLTGMGIAFAAMGVLGLLALAALFFLPRGLLAGVLGRPAMPDPNVTWATLAPTPDPEAALEATPAPTPDFRLNPNAPRLYTLWVPKLGLQAPVTPVSRRLVEVEGQAAWQLDVPNAFAAGWSDTSAPVGTPGNAVFVGHNNEFGDVFKDLWYLEAGDEIVVYSAEAERRYRVAEMAYFEERDLPLAQRAAQAAWIAPTPDERLTLVTCWPYHSNTHRLVVVARPA